MQIPISEPMPTSVRVGTVTYRITDDRDEWVRFEYGMRRSGDFGHTDNGAATIFLNPDHGGDVQRQTLWHEVLHAAHWTVMGSPNWQGLGEDNDSREETVIKMWEHPTLAVLRDNPALVRYLMGDA